MNSKQGAACLCELVSLTQELVSNSAGATIESREVCIEVDGEVISAFAVIQVGENGSTLLRYEDAQGNELTGQVVDCECPCVTSEPPVASRVAFRNDFLTLDGMDSEGVWPITFAGSVNDDNGNNYNFDIAIARDPSWTDMSQVYQSLVEEIDAIPGVEASFVDVSNYNSDGAQDICVGMPAGYAFKLDRGNANSSGTIGGYTITVGDTETTVRAIDNGGNIIPSPVFWYCDGSGVVGSDNTFTNTES